MSYSLNICTMERWHWDKLVGRLSSPQSGSIGVKVVGAKEIALRLFRGDEEAIKEGFEPKTFSELAAIVQMGLSDGTTSSYVLSLLADRGAIHPLPKGKQLKELSLKDREAVYEVRSLFKAFQEQLREIEEECHARESEPSAWSGSMCSASWTAALFSRLVRLSESLRRLEPLQGDPELMELYRGALEAFKGLSLCWEALLDADLIVLYREVHSYIAQRLVAIGKEGSSVAFMVDKRPVARISAVIAKSLSKYINGIIACGGVQKKSGEDEIECAIDSKEGVGPQIAWNETLALLLSRYLSTLDVALIDGKNLFHLLALADYLGIAMLKWDCEEWISEEIESFEDALLFELPHMAQLFHSKRIIGFCFKELLRRDGLRGGSALLEMFVGLTANMGGEKIGEPFRLGLYTIGMGSKASLHWIRALQGLTQLQLKEGVGKEAVAKIAQMEQLTHLDLWEVALEPQQFAPISRMKGLTHLGAPRFLLSTEEGNRQLSMMGQLRSLIVSADNALSDEGLSALGELRQLSFLALRELPGVTGSGFHHFQGMKQLREGHVHIAQ